MNCLTLQRQIHPYVDGELPPRNVTQLEEHLSACPLCQQQHRELVTIREGLRPRRLSQAHQEWLWERIQVRLQPSRPTARPTLVKRVAVILREFEPRAVGFRLAAIPITLGLFLTVFVQFEPTLFREWTPASMVITLSSSPSASLPVVRQVPVRYPRAQLQDLMSAVRRLPFEDSLSLVAEITPEGHAHIDDVLEYPRSHELLNAVDLTLRASAFQRASRGTQGQPFVIYSLQKVDVYGEYEGRLTSPPASGL